MHGPITRIMSCTDDEVKKLDEVVFDSAMGNTHIAPSWKKHPATGRLRENESPGKQQVKHFMLKKN